MFEVRARFAKPLCQCEVVTTVFSLTSLPAGVLAWDKSIPDSSTILLMAVSVLSSFKSCPGDCNVELTQEELEMFVLALILFWILLVLLSVNTVE